MLGKKGQHEYNCCRSEMLYCHMQSQVCSSKERIEDTVHFGAPKSMRQQTNLYANLRFCVQNSMEVLTFVVVNCTMASTERATAARVLSKRFSAHNGPPASDTPHLQHHVSVQAAMQSAEEYLNTEGKVHPFALANHIPRPARKVVEGYVLNLDQLLPCRHQHKPYLRGSINYTAEVVKYLI